MGKREPDSKRRHIQVSNKVWEKIKQEAEKQGVSITQLIAKILNEKFRV